MTTSFLPEYNAVPVRGGYRGSYRLFDSQPFRFIPGCEPYPTAGQALTAAKEYVRLRLNPPIRGEVTEAKDVLGLAAWHVEKAAQRAAEQEQALGAIIVKGRQVKVERRRA
ncbi:hypothetical protein [Mesorhizobium sp. B2-5-11]|uniref:hypothetical protein n=1 Tax=Mesorhizobium sp. B2-5-11 TaxID=2589919 RepID=UPI0011272DBC|nr:hypothetical protein [Mesorhizobium sp. B2-5-11]TPK14151.1 hypothetical protein FJ490_02175 [Mesorhizobium sp. B2-5-11]